MSYVVRSSLASGLALCLVAGAARAEPTASDRATARVLADEAGDALDQKNYEVAADKFGRADALVHAPTLLLGLARAEVGQHKYVEASENYQRIIREGVAPGAPASFAKALQDAQREIKAITPKLAWLTISLKEPGASVVTIDGVPLPKASADGYNPTTTTIDVKEGESKAVALVLDPLTDSGTTAPTPATITTETAAPTATADASDDASSSASRQRTYGFIGLGVGAAGLVVGGIAGLVAIGRHNTLETECPNGKCQPSGQATIDGFRSMAAVSTVGFIVGGVAAAAGGALILTAPHAKETGRVQPFVGFGTVGARVIF